MERESNQMQALCRSGCGFYGSPATDGLCSICYKEHLKKKQQLPTNTPASLSSYRESSAAAAQSTVGNTLHNSTNLSECLHTSGKDHNLSLEDNNGASTITATTTTTTNNLQPTNLSNPENVAIIPSSSTSCGSNGIEQQSTSSPSRSTIASAAAISSIVEESANLSTSGCDDKDDADDKDSDSDAKKKKKNRCATCRKKVGLTGFECRCGGQYCSVHRYSDKHDCSFNYREMGAQEIRRNNPVVVGEKIQKI